MILVVPTYLLTAAVMPSVHAHCHLPLPSARRPNLVGISRKAFIGKVLLSCLFRTITVRNNQPSFTGSLTIACIIHCFPQIHPLASKLAFAKIIKSAGRCCRDVLQKKKGKKRPRTLPAKSRQLARSQLSSERDAWTSGTFNSQLFQDSEPTRLFFRKNKTK